MKEKLVKGRVYEIEPENLTEQYALILFWCAPVPEVGITLFKSQAQAEAAKKRLHRAIGSPWNKRASLHVIRYNPDTAVHGACLMHILKLAPKEGKVVHIGNARGSLFTVETALRALKPPRTATLATKPRR